MTPYYSTDYKATKGDFSATPRSDLQSAHSPLRYARLLSQINVVSVYYFSEKNSRALSIHDLWRGLWRELSF